RRLGSERGASCAWRLRRKINLLQYARAGTGRRLPRTDLLISSPQIQYRFPPPGRPSTARRQLGRRLHIPLVWRITTTPGQYTEEQQFSFWLVVVNHPNTDGKPNTQPNRKFPGPLR